MIGLSLTAIGLRPLERCLAIYDELRSQLSLAYLELAVGVVCPVDAEYGGVPLTLHDSCLWTERGRARLDPLRPQSWPTYRAFIEANRVVGVSVHAPLRSRCTKAQLEAGVHDMEQALGVAVAVEVMPEPGRWCSSMGTLIEHALLVDVSHLHIWEHGDQTATAGTLARIADNHEIAAVHVSHNDGRADSHELIPEGVWFEPLISQWAANHLVTYESLPVSHAKHERLDTRRNRWSNATIQTN